MDELFKLTRLGRLSDEEMRANGKAYIARQATQSVAMDSLESEPVAMDSEDNPYELINAEYRKHHRR